MRYLRDSEGCSGQWWLWVIWGKLSNQCMKIIVQNPVFIISKILSRTQMCDFNYSWGEIWYCLILNIIVASGWRKGYMHVMCATMEFRLCICSRSVLVSNGCSMQSLVTNQELVFCFIQIQINAWVLTFHCERSVRWGTNLVHWFI